MNKIKVDKHKVTLTDDEIKIILNALESADFYTDDNKFWIYLDKLKNRLKRLLDFEYVWRSYHAGYMSYIYQKYGKI